MHRRTLPILHKYVPAIKSILYKHAVQHHAIYYKEFTHEPDPEGRYISIYPNFPITLILAIPVAVTLWLLSPTLAIVFTLGLSLHHVVWAFAHKEMHIPSNIWFRRWALFKWLARNHWMHHRYRSVNYNFAFPLADHLFGTYRAPDTTDLAQMSMVGI
jgi:sterol desaturase/sphingolipid hydroxylase (fatty acid hydroxylase superfamily)